MTFDLTRSTMEYNAAPERRAFFRPGQQVPTCRRHIRRVLWRDRGTAMPAAASGTRRGRRTPIWSTRWGSMGGLAVRRRSPYHGMGRVTPDGGQWAVMEQGDEGGESP